MRLIDRHCSICQLWTSISIEFFKEGEGEFHKNTLVGCLPKRQVFKIWSSTQTVTRIKARCHKPWWDKSALCDNVSAQLKGWSGYILSFKKHMANRHIFLGKWHVPASAVTNLVQYFGNFFRTMNNGILIFVPAILMTSSRRAAIATSQYPGWHFFLHLQDAASGRKKRRGG